MHFKKSVWITKMPKPFTNTRATSKNCKSSLRFILFSFRPTFLLNIKLLMKLFYHPTKRFISPATAWHLYILKKKIPEEWYNAEIKKRLSFLYSNKYESKDGAAADNQIHIQLTRVRFPPLPASSPSSVRLPNIEGLATSRLCDIACRIGVSSRLCSNAGQMLRKFHKNIYIFCAV